MCECNEKVTTEITDFMKEKISKEVGFMSIDESGFKNRVWLTLSGRKVPFYLPFVVEYTRKAKSSGKVRTYKKETSIHPTYCPFCGDKYNEEVT